MKFSKKQKAYLKGIGVWKQIKKSFKTCNVTFLTKKQIKEKKRMYIDINKDDWNHQFSDGEYDSLNNPINRSW